MRPVEATPLVHHARTDRIYGPLSEEAAKVADRYTTEELQAIADFLTRANELSASHLERVHRLRATPSRAGSEGA